MKNSGTALSRRELFKQALEALIVDYPNSVVASLMTHFSPEIVIDFIQIYSGQQISVPKVESVWKSYRNRVICETLSVKNDKNTREKLAVFFGISSSWVSMIYSDEKKKRRVVGSRTIQLAAKRVHMDEMRRTLKDAKDILFEKRKKMRRR